MTRSAGPWDHPASGTCTRADLARRLRALGYTHREARAMVADLFDLMVHTLAEGEPVKLSGFGRFDPVARAPHPGRDLAAGTPMEVPGHRTVAFRPAGGLRDALTRALGEVPR